MENNGFSREHCNGTTKDHLLDDVPMGSYADVHVNGSSIDIGTADVQLPTNDVIYRFDVDGVTTGQKGDNDYKRNNDEDEYERCTSPVKGLAMKKVTL